MITLLLSIFLAGVASAASHSIHDFSCRTETQIDRTAKTTRFSFSVENLTQGKISYHTDDDSSDEPVKMVPADSSLMLNDNWGIRRTKDGIKMDSDGDGFQFTNVVLYENSDFRAGYAKIEFSDTTKPRYSKVTCKVTER